MLISAPPELPGLIAASVWMKKPKSEMPICERASAETMPLVVVWPTPNGLPMASTRSPTSSASELPIGIDRERIRRLDLEHGEVEGLVLEQQLALEFAAVGRRDLHRVGIADHVEIGDDDAGRIDQHAGAQRLLQARRHLAVAEELLEERIAREWRARAHLLRGIDVDDRRRGVLHQRREGELHLGPAERHALVVGRLRRNVAVSPLLGAARVGAPPATP